MTHQIAATAIQALSYSQETCLAAATARSHDLTRGRATRCCAAQYLVVSQQQARAVADGLYLSVVCAEDVPFYPESGVPSQVPSYLPANLEMLEKACALWPHAQLSAPPGPSRGDAPALLLSGEADPVTPPENAAQAARYLLAVCRLPPLGWGITSFFGLPARAGSRLCRGCQHPRPGYPLRGRHPTIAFLPDLRRTLTIVDFRFLDC